MAFDPKQPDTSAFYSQPLTSSREHKGEERRTRLEQNNGLGIYCSHAQMVDISNGLKEPDIVISSHTLVSVAVLVTTDSLV